MRLSIMSREDLDKKKCSIIRIIRMFEKGHYDHDHLTAEEVKAKIQTMKVELALIEETIK